MELKRISALVAVAAALAACGDQPAPAGPDGPGPRSEAASAGAPRFRHAGIDREYVRLARRVPGFAGYSYDAQGNAVIRLQETARGPAALAALGEVVRDARFVRAPKRFAQASYNFIQLADWKASITASLGGRGLPEFVAVDADEDANRVWLAVKPGTPPARVDAVLAALGIPREAVVVEEMAPIYTTQSLTSRRRPTSGGLALNASGENCTLGFNRYAPTGGTTGPIYGMTASHCTRTPYGPDVNGVTSFYQPWTTSSSDLLGQESVDPVPQPAGTGPYSDDEHYYTGIYCPQNYTCRLSDAAAFRYEPRANAVVGYITRTSGGPNGGSLQINRPDSLLQVVFYMGEPTSGVGGPHNMHKIGAVTGWTSGPRIRNCFDVRPINPNTGADFGIVLMCQQAAEGGQQGGDSGAPVFAMQNASDPSWGVALHGIAWGAGTTATGATFFAYSDLFNIGEEFGQF